MACFIVPAAEAIVTTVAAKKAKNSEAKQEHREVATIPFSRKLSWLRNMLWGGAALLAFEHVWHGEIVPHLPFLTAAADSADRAQMFREMATVGVTMAVLVTVVWLCMLAFCAVLEKREQRKAAEESGS